MIDDFQIPEELDRKMELLEWRYRAEGVPPWKWEIVKLNLARRVIARYGDATWHRDLVVAGLKQQQAGGRTP